MSEGEKREVVSFSFFFFLLFLLNLNFNDKGSFKTVILPLLLSGRCLQVHVPLSITTEPPPPPRQPPSDADTARRLRWINNFLRANSIERPTNDPSITPAWFSLVPNVIGKPDMHQVSHSKQQKERKRRRKK
jgi:hypothetical protein